MPEGFDKKGINGLPQERISMKRFLAGRKIRIGLLLLLFFSTSPQPLFGEIMLAENDRYSLSISPYIRIDGVAFNNVIDLGQNETDDSDAYTGFDYSMGFDLELKDEGPHLYLKLERNGPYDYDAPLFSYERVSTSTGDIKNYQNEELLPHVEEYWADVPLWKILPLRFKGGLFAFETGHGISLGGYYENYGAVLYSENESFKWHFYYFRPDYADKYPLGPNIPQEKKQGIDYEHSKANFFAADMVFSWDKNVFRPYVGILLDRTDGKRTNYFATPTDRDILGTAGLAWDLELDSFYISAEAARNFGRAKSDDPSFDDVEHAGYCIYAETGCNFGKFDPHTRFFLASGNKITTEMVDDETLRSHKNRAFSVYSPLNANLADSLSPPISILPLVAMGTGWGLNYGINRPTTFDDPGLLENIILFNLGFGYELTDKLSFTFDWWKLKSQEKGIGTFDGVTKRLSSDLGNEIDGSLCYAVNNNIEVNITGGYFFPGEYYGEMRDDTEGSLFTPFVRGDGNPEGAYQAELSLTLTF